MNTNSIYLNCRVMNEGVSDRRSYAMCTSREVVKIPGSAPSLLAELIEHHCHTQIFAEYYVCRVFSISGLHPEFAIYADVCCYLKRGYSEKSVSSPIAFLFLLRFKNDCGQRKATGFHQCFDKTCSNPCHSTVGQHDTKTKCWQIPRVATSFVIYASFSL